MSISKSYEYMDEQTISAFLRCCVCKNPFVDPVTADDSRRGCRSCLSDSHSVTSIQEWIVLQMLDGLLVQCLKCGETNIQRGKLELHEQTECKEATVSCKNADVKCPWQDTRAKRDKHMVECVFTPLRPALKEIITENQKLQERVQKLERLLQQAQERQ